MITEENEEDGEQFNKSNAPEKKTGGNTKPGDKCINKFCIDEHCIDEPWIDELCIDDPEVAIETEAVCSQEVLHREDGNCIVYALNCLQFSTPWIDEPCIDDPEVEIETEGVVEVSSQEVFYGEGRIVPHELDVCHNKFSSTVRNEQKNLNARAVRQIRENSHKDNECERMIEQNGQLKRYQETHSGERRFLCEICGNAFARKYDLKKHMIYHSEKRHFTCGTCGRGFAHKYKLNQHMVCHSGKRPFSCDKCGAAFLRKYDLKYHMISHSEKSNFVCDICERTFKFKGNLTRHKRIHSQDRLHL